jgi:hypothetical protein
MDQNEMSNLYRGTSIDASYQLNILTNWTTALGVNSVLNDKLITDWSVGNMNPDVTQ